MGRIAAERFLQFVPVLLLSTLVVFVMLHLAPGDPAEQQLGKTGSVARAGGAPRRARRAASINSSQAC